MAEKVRAAIVALRIADPKSARGVVTASVGVATGYPGDPTLDPAILIERADRALYQAKQSGRNQVADRSATALGETS